MTLEIVLLILHAMVVYFLVLSAHSLRYRYGPVHFYALLGAITAIMSWVTDAGVTVQFAGITFVVGSTVFYTSILLGIFVIYVFDGPAAARIAISTVIGVSILTPLISAMLNYQMSLNYMSTITMIPHPSLRINSASVLATFFDMIFLAVVWEFLGRSAWRFHLSIRAYFTLLGVMCLDVVLFSTMAFAGTPVYLDIATGTLISRLAISILAFPFLYGYLVFQSRQKGQNIVNRPVLSIIRQVAEIRAELNLAQDEIEARKKAEKERDEVIIDLKKALSEVKTLQGLIPICAHCKNIRDDQGFWNKIESYIHQHSDVQFSHGICPDCMKKYYPDVWEDISENSVD